MNTQMLCYPGNEVKRCCTTELYRLEAAQATSNPNTFLMQELRVAEDATHRFQQEAADAQSTLQRQANELRDCKAQLSAVQADLRVCNLHLR